VPCRTRGKTGKRRNLGTFKTQAAAFDRIASESRQEIRLIPDQIEQQGDQTYETACDGISGKSNFTLQRQTLVTRLTRFGL